MRIVDSCACDIPYTNLICCWNGGPHGSTVTQFLQVYFAIDILFTQFTSATSRS